MSVWRRIDINLQTGNTVLYRPVLPLVIYTPKMPVQVSQRPSTKGKDRCPHPLPSLESHQGVLQKTTVISICNTLWSTHLRRHQFCSPEGVLLQRSSSPLVRLLAKTCVLGVATPRVNICCCLQWGFSCGPHLGGCSPLAAPAAAWASALSTCSPPPPLGGKREQYGTDRCFFASLICSGESSSNP